MLFRSSDPAKLEAADAGNRMYLGRRVDKGTLSRESLETAMNLIGAATDLEALAGCQLVIEAVFEDREVKRDVFQQLSELCGPEVILATNSSAFPISQLVHDLPFPDRACNLHFFHPVLVMRLVEVMRGPETSDETIAACLEFARRIDKEAVFVEREISGLIVNRVLAAIKREALWLADEGYAEPEDIDRAVKLGLNHPMGPFELTDFSGLDVFYGIMRQRFEESGDPAWKPPKLLEDKVQAGELGRKTGKGFYSY